MCEGIKIEVDVVCVCGGGDYHKVRRSHDYRAFGDAVSLHCT